MTKCLTLRLKSVSKMLFVQEGGTVSESFIPLFDGEGVVKKVDKTNIK